MPRNGSDVYSLPAGSTAVDGEIALATTHNTPLTDIAADLNLVRPLTAGGTGAATAIEARSSLEIAFEISTVTALKADTTLDYTGGSGLYTVAAGDYVRVAEGDHVYIVLSSGGSGDIATSASTPVQLDALIGQDGKWRFEQFGVTGAADDIVTLQAAVDAVSAAGGGTLTGLLTNYTIDATQTVETNVIILCMKDGVHLEGPFTLTWGQTDGATAMIYLEDGITSGSIRGITVNANDAALTGPTWIKGIHKQGTLDDYVIDDVIVKNASSYGIGMGDDGGATGYTANCRFTNLKIQSSGNDGFDLKDGNASTGNNLWENIEIDSFGLNGAFSDRAGLDARGPNSLINNVRILNAGANATRGIKVAGDNPENTVLSNFYSDVSAQTGAVGLYCQGENGSYANGIVKTGGGAGVQLLTGSSNSKLTAIDAIGSDSASGTGIQLLGTTDTRIKVTACDVKTYNDGFNVRGDRTSLVGCHTNDNDQRGYNIAATADLTEILGGSIETTGTPISDSGTNTRIRNVGGFVNEARVTVTGLSTASGPITGTVAHGLDVTPALKDVAVSVIGMTDTAPNFSVSVVGITAVDATNITYIVGLAVTSAETLDLGFVVTAY